MKRLFAPIDISPPVVFRIVFGAAVLRQVRMFFQYDWISFYWIDAPPVVKEGT